MKRKKERVIIACSACGNEVTASPGMARWALSGAGVCVKCGGNFKPPERPA